MRVYEIATFNYNRIRFKENMDFISGLLTQNNVKYTDICFHLNGISVAMRKIDKAIPSLLKYGIYATLYVNNNAVNYLCNLTSIKCDENNNITEYYIDRADTDDLIQALKKVPNPYNFGLSYVILEGIDWFGDGMYKRIVYKNEYKDPQDDFYLDNNYYSNCIVTRKEFDFGNKFNYIQLKIDRTDENGGLRPLPEAYKSVFAALGKPIFRELKCVYEDNEKEKLKEIYDRTESHIRSDNTYKEISNGFYEKHKITREEEYDALVQNRHPVTGYSPKKIFNNSAKKYGYKYIGFRSGVYTYEKINENGHKFAAEILFLPFSEVSETYIKILGYNFSHQCNGGIAGLLKEEEVAKDYAEINFNIMSFYEKEYSDILLEAYGKTPDWYWL